MIVNNELSGDNFEVQEKIIDAVEQLPIAGKREAKKTFYLTVTAYSSTVDQCDGDPFTTASGETVHDGIIAYNYLPFGTKVRFPEMFPEKVFEVQDRLRAGASTYLADLWMETREEAIQWGAKVLKIEIL
ncbi:3D domain-containing protein [Patescibacteria group bacterium]|nr:3D domain-containing protein [Patescibacteria group bacterium]MBU1074734.1 3D domain-containing protein [Patescibacteria group bacterium]MBU1951869.1 3D domain-containing protein [Patescibacteria group bacterium]